MKSHLYAACLAPLLSFAAAPASAVVYGVTLNSLTTTGTMSTSVPVPGAYDVSFIWSDTPYIAYAVLYVDEPFALSLVSYTGRTSNNDVSGYTFENVTGLTEAPTTVASTRYTTETSNCHSAVAPLTHYSGACNLVAASTSTAGQAAGAAHPGDELFPYFDAGAYRLGFYDSSSPTEGRAVFRLTTLPEVPLPAGGALLLSGLVGLGLARRRKAD